MIKKHQNTHRDSQRLKSVAPSNRSAASEDYQEDRSKEQATAPEIEHSKARKEIRSPVEVAESQTDLRRQQDIESYMNTIMQQPRVSEFEVDLAFRNAKLRVSYLARNDFIPSNPNERESMITREKLLRWRYQGKIFSVNSGDTILFPAFQFDDSKPKPIIEVVLSELPQEMHFWQVAIWFDSSNGWLNWECPQSCLDRWDDVHKAARQEALASCF